MVLWQSVSNDFVNILLQSTPWTTKQLSNVFAGYGTSSKTVLRFPSLFIQAIHRNATYSIPALTSLTAHSPGDTFVRSPCGPIHIVMAAGLPVDFISFYHIRKELDGQRGQYVTLSITMNWQGRGKKKSPYFEK